MDAQSPHTVGEPNFATEQTMDKKMDFSGEIAKNPVKGVKRALLRSGIGRIVAFWLEESGLSQNLGQRPSILSIFTLAGKFWPEMRSFRKN